MLSDCSRCLRRVNAPPKTEASSHRLLPSWHVPPPTSPSLQTVPPLSTPTLTSTKTTGTNSIFKYARRRQATTTSTRAHQRAARGGFRPDDHPSALKGWAEQHLPHETMPAATWHSIYACGAQQEEWEAEGVDFGAGTCKFHRRAYCAYDIWRFRVTCPIHLIQTLTDTIYRKYATGSANPKIAPATSTT